MGQCHPSALIGLHLLTLASLHSGVHFIAGLRRILSGASPTGDRIATLSALTSAIHPDVPPADTLHAIARTSAGVPGSIKIAWSSEASIERSYTFLGSRAQLKVDFSANEAKTIRVTITPATEGPQTREVKRVEVLEFETAAMKEEFAWFARAIAGGAESEAAKEVEERSGSRMALRDVAVIEAALKSEGGLVDVIELLGELA